MVRVGDIKIGSGQPLVLIAGPCVIESEEICMEIADRLVKITTDLKISFIFKASYDKANRLSLNSFRGPGLSEGLRILRAIKETFHLPVLTDVHCQRELLDLAEIVDIIQIPAFLCRQTDLVVEAARLCKAINIKKGQFITPYDMKHILDKVISTGNEQVLLTERGTSFGYNNLVVDFRALPIMQEWGYPVIFDATHSVQLPGGGEKGVSGGQRQFVAPLARAATAVGCDGLFMETHFNPQKALCDGPNMINLDDLPSLLKCCLDITIDRNRSVIGEKVGGEI